MTLKMQRNCLCNTLSKINSIKAYGVIADLKEIIVLIDAYKSNDLKTVATLYHDNLIFNTPEIFTNLETNRL